MRGNAILSFLREPRGAWTALGIAMLASAALILFATHGQSFAIDELFYYGRVVDKQHQLAQYSPFSPEYLLAPFNSHLPLGGRFVYEAVFATVGAEYLVFVLINIAALCACVALTFELARRRIGTIAALAPCIVILFLGFAREQLLWPFDLHTGLSLAAGLGAVLAIQRGDRRGDVLACLLLILSVATIELGLSFALGIAAWLSLDRSSVIRRVWVALIPVALYAIWWVWARKFDQSQASVSNMWLIPETFLNGGASVWGSLTGTNPVLPASYATEVTWFGRALAVATAGALAVRFWLGSLPRTIWVWLAVLTSYWLLLAIADRAPQGSRYILVGVVIVVLIAADAVRRPLSDRVAVVLLALALVALPANIAQLVENRDEDTLHRDIPVSRTEFAMLELAEDHVDPAYMVTTDPRVVDAGGGLFIGLPAGAYLHAAAHNGSLAFSLDEVRRQAGQLRGIADAALAGALRLGIEHAAAPRGGNGCRTVTARPAADHATFVAPPGRTLLRSRDGRAALWLRRFADSPRSVGIAWLPPRRWVSLAIPADSASEPWRATVDATVTACFQRR